MSNNTTKLSTEAKIKAAYEAAMNEVKEKYSHLTIKDNSLIQEEAHPKFKNKRRVIVICDCSVEVERATSDLHTFIGCDKCKKLVRKANKTLKKGGKLLMTPPKEEEVQEEHTEEVETTETETEIAPAQA